jgi:hypothetical protein
MVGVLHADGDRNLRPRAPLAIEVGHGLSGGDVVATLEWLRFECGLPRRIFCDNGTEFVSAAWAFARTRTASSSTSAGAASRQTTPRLNRSTVGYGKNA